MKKIKVCSLFSGIGGFETGIFNALGREKVEVVFASEINKFASKSYEIIYNHKPQGDVTKINEKEIPNHDLLVAGFPCQAFSVAGKRLGFEDTRGTLFFEVARIAKEKQPKVLLLENVKGLLSHDNGKTIDTIIKVLSDLNYKVDFELLNSKNFGVAQNRERIFIVAIKNTKNEIWSLNSSNSIINKTKERLLHNQNIKMFNFDFPQSKIITEKIKDILEENVDEKFYMKETMTSDLIEKIRQYEMVSKEADKNEIKKIVDIPKDIINDNERQRRLYSIEGISPTVLARPDTPKILMVGYLNIKGGKQIRSVYDEEGLSPTIDTAQGGHRQVKVLIKKEPTYIIRKLTPLECFRLQGFPDSYYEKLKQHNISNTQLYKMAGNAVTTNTITAIVKKMKNYLK